MQVYNTLNRSKEQFQPLEDNHVRMYVCGITAYDNCHIGHARSAVVFDVLVRYLRSLGYKVTFVRNFTDVDDKIINKANQENLSTTEVSEKYIQTFYDDMDRLNVLRATVEPKATEHIKEMISLTHRLVEKNHAYVTGKGDVYFRVRSYEDYGRLSGKDIEDLQSGARIAPGSEKEDPLDFALWKHSREGEPSWESPWGMGRPGWHLECSAMSEKYLGLPFDIHGGGQDLSFPHHENERAQSEADTGNTFARYWIHNGFVQVNAEKMSKSLGNFVTIKHILDRYHPEVLRFFLLTKHYRSPLDFSWENLDEAEKGIKRIYVTLDNITSELERKKWSKSPLPEEFEKNIGEITTSMDTSMSDDLNTAKTLGHFFEIIRLANRLLENKTWRKSEQARDIFQTIENIRKKWSDILGIFLLPEKDFLAALKQGKAQRKGLDVSRIEDLIGQRNKARKEKDFTQSDSIRDELQNMGVEVMDSPQGTTWDIE